MPNFVKIELMIISSSFHVRKCVKTWLTFQNWHSLKTYRQSNQVTFIQCFNTSNLLLVSIQSITSFCVGLLSVEFREFSKTKFANFFLYFWWSHSWIPADYSYTGLESQWKEVIEALDFVTPQWRHRGALDF